MRMRPLLAALALAWLLPVAAVTAVPATAEADDTPRVELVIFHRDGCPHCARALAWLETLQVELPDLRITRYEVSTSAANRELFARMAADHGIEPTAVPTMFLGELYWVGIDDEVEAQIEAAARVALTGRQPIAQRRSTVDVPGFGAVDVGDASLLVATIVIGFADGLNPCSFWVLSVLFALVLRSGSRRRVVAVGTVFLAVTAALYGLYMFGAYSALEYADRVTWIRAVVAIVAGTFGVLHLKEYATSSGPSLTIPERRKPGMYRSMRALADPERSLPAVLSGTVVLAAGVSLAETPCTAGLPLMWTTMLSDAGTSGAATAALFIVYLAVFLLDELVVFGLAVVAMRAVRLQERRARHLQLVSGALMLALATTMLAAPGALTTLGGTISMFAITGAAVGAVLLAEAWHERRHPGSRQPGSRRPQASAATSASARKTALRAR